MGLAQARPICPGIAVTTIDWLVVRKSGDQPEGRNNGGQATIQIESRAEREGRFVNIDTTGDLIRALRNDPDVRNTIREVVLGQGFEHLPEDVRQVRETQTAILEEQKGLRKDTNALLKTQNAMLDTVGVMLKELTHTRRLHRQEYEGPCGFRGNYAIETTRRVSAIIAMELAQHLGADSVFMEMPLTQGELKEMYPTDPEAISALKLRPHAAARFQSADLVALAEKRKDCAGVTGSFYLVAEASCTVRSSDVEKVLEHARIVHAATDIDTYAVVSGVRVAPSVSDRVVDDPLEYLNSEDESLVFWYRLTQVLEPEDTD